MRGLKCVPIRLSLLAAIAIAAANIYGSACNAQNMDGSPLAPGALGGERGTLSATSREAEVDAGIVGSVHIPVSDLVFDEIAERAKSLVQSKERRPSGHWKLSSVYEGYFQAMWSVVREANGFQQHLKLHDDWIAKRPESAQAVIMKAILLNMHARMAMMQPPGSPAAAGPVVHQQRLAMLRDWLESRKAVGSKDPYWYALMLEVYRDQRASPENTIALLQEAAQREPAYYLNYATALDALLAHSPYTFSGKDLDAIAATAVRLAGDAEGDMAYARMYLYGYRNRFGAHAIANPDLDWPRMVRSMNAILSRYPDDWNRQYFALFSCIAGDQAAAREYFEAMTERPIRQIWQEWETFQHCRDWADVRPVTNKQTGVKKAKGDGLRRLGKSQTAPETGK
jgi:hypothetical protein